MYNFTLNVCDIFTSVYIERKNQCISNSFKFFYLLFLLYGTRTFFKFIFHSHFFIFMSRRSFWRQQKKNIWKKNFRYTHAQQHVQCQSKKKIEIITLRHCKISYVVRKRNTHTNYCMRNIHICIILVISIECKVFTVHFLSEFFVYNWNFPQKIQTNCFSPPELRVSTTDLDLYVAQQISWLFYTLFSDLIQLDNKEKCNWTNEHTIRALTHTFHLNLK